MKYYAHYNDLGLALVGTQESVEGAERVELDIDQAKSLLSGKTSWRDWEVIELDGKPELARVKRELKFLGAVKSLKPVLNVADMNKSMYVYLTLSRRPFALVGEREVNILKAKKLLREKRVDLWQVK